ncbi:MAG: hypothetical protein AAGA77_04840 [Bacteroidota bacterium]
MKRYIFLMVALMWYQSTSAQRVGINTATPDASAILDIHGTDGGLLIPRLSTTQRTNINTPVSGLLVYDTDEDAIFQYTGSIWVELSPPTFENVNNTVRNKGSHTLDDFIFGEEELPAVGNTTGEMFFFDKSKRAFRGGALTNSSSWQPDNIGLYSFAFGRNVRASGDNSVALGISSIASGEESFAFGNDVEASGDFGATAFGNITSSSGGYGSFAAGFETHAEGTSSIAMGNENSSFGSASVAMGDNNMTYGDNGAVAIGKNLQAYGDVGAVFGQFNDPIVAQGANLSNISPLLTVGNGKSSGSRSNAFMVRLDGKVGIGTDTPEERLQVQGAIIIGNTSNSSPESGTIRYNGSDFEGYGGGSWNSLTQNNSPAQWQDVGIHITNANSGNVGIGTDTPDERLQVQGAINIGNTTNPSPESGTIRYNGSDFEGYDGGSWNSLTQNNSPAQWQDAGVHITNANSGNVGIGEIFPSEKLHVNGALKVGDASSETPAAGTIRWNASTSDFEGYDSSSWKSLTSGGGGNTNGNSFDPEWGTVPASITYEEYHPVTQGISNGEFAHSMEISGSFIVISADESATANGESVYVYSDFAGGLVEESVLEGDFAATKFGLDVSIQGEYLAVGAPFEEVPDGGGGQITNAGVVYLYQKDSGLNTWSFHSKINASDPQATAAFGTTVELFGNYLAVGVPQFSESGFAGAGAVYVYELSGGTWTEIHKFVLSDPFFGDNFGADISMSGSFMLVGVPQWDSNCVGCFGVGKVEVYKNNSGSFSHFETLYGDTTVTSALALFGSSIDNEESVLGHVIGIGAPGKDKAYVFDETTDVFTLIQSVVGTDVSTNDDFGTSIDISNEMLVIGAPEDDNGRGSAYLFEPNGGSWEQIAKFNAGDRAENDKFGTSVAMKSSKIFIGTPFDDDQNTNGGSFYIMKKNE